MYTSRFNEMWTVVDKYKIEFDCDIPDTFLCILCRRVLRNAKQISCGCRFCAQCLEGFFNSGNSCCPGDSEECRQQVFSDDIDSYDDHFANKEISKLVAKCVFDGCNERDCVKKICEHVTICQFSMESCLECNILVKRYAMEEHLNSICGESIIECCFCKQSMTRKSIESLHHNVDSDSLCERYESVCQYNCGVNERVIMKEHLRVCTNRALYCPYRELGCASDAVLCSMMEGHLCQEGYRHANILLQTISNLENEVNRMKSSVNTGIECINLLEDKVSQLQNDNVELKRNLENQRDAPSNNDIRSDILNLSRRLDLCDMKYEKKNFQYIWRVTNFKNLVAQSENEANKRLLSDPFFTSKNGYRMRMILYANGLDEYQGSFISLYYELLSGKFDDILSWPFQHNVELRLLDQGGNNHQVVNLFYDPTNRDMLVNYQRPPVGNNVPLFGCPNFVSKQTLNRFQTLKKHDTLFIQFSATPVNMTE